MAKGRLYISFIEDGIDIINVFIDNISCIESLYIDDDMGNIKHINIKTTMFHPFYVQSDEEESTLGIWIAASNLASGDKLFMENGQGVYVE